MKVRQTILSIAIAACLAVSAQADVMFIGDAVPLSDLIGGSMTVGDKIFSGFDYLATGDMPASEDVNVQGIIDCDGNYGFRMQGGFLDLPGGSPSDALVSFDVNVMPAAGMQIHDVHLSFNGAVLGGTGLATITETFLPDFPGLSLSVYDNGTDRVLSAWADLPELVGPGLPIETLHVQKDVLLFAGAGSAGATMSFFDQTFSQVPEPSCLSLLAFAFAFAGLTFRRKK